MFFKLVDFFSYFIDNEKKNIRTQANETVEKACSSMDNCLQNLIAKSETWLADRRREREHHEQGLWYMICELAIVKNGM
jgi:hypothetical protein